MEKRKYITVTLKEPLSAAVEIDIDFSQPLLASMQVDQVKRNLAHEIRKALMEKITTLHIDDLKFEFKEGSPNS